MKNIPINKYFWLIDLLNRKGGASLDEINECWGKSSLNDNPGSRIPVATFQNWKRSIRAVFGIEIGYSKARNAYYLDDDGNGIDGRHIEWMMRSLAVAEVVRNSSVLKDRILLEPMPSGERWLSTMVAAMKENSVVEMMYEPFVGGETHCMELKPYCLKTFKQRWYVVGESSNHSEPYRVYALDRIKALSISEKHFVMPKDLNCADIFRDLYGVWVGTDREVETVRVRVKELEAKYLRTLPLHWSQTESGPSKKEGWVEFSWRLKVTYDFIMELRSRGKALKIVEPKWVVGEM